MSRPICPDGGACHHGCLHECFRVRHCDPLTIARFPGGRWPEGAAPVRPTDAEVAALVWLLARGDGTRLRGGDFVHYYEERERARLLAEGYGPSLRDHVTTPRAHAWRRTGGAVLGRMAAKGLVRRVEWRHGVPEYEVTSAGRTAAGRV